MKIARSARYALCAALDMTLAGEETVSAARVAERHGIPEAVLAKVFQQLVRAGLAQGTRGVGGGYRLTRPASELTVLDVIRVFEPREGSTRPDDCRAGKEEDRLRALFRETDELVRSTLESVTLATVARGPRLRVERPSAAARR